MPELPEVETVRRSLEPAIVDARVVAVYGSRAPLRGERAPAAALRRRWVGRRLERLVRRGKFLLLHAGSSPFVLLVHLGMSGRWVLEGARTRRPPHTHLELTLEGAGVLRLIAPRRFARALLLDRNELALYAPLARLGPEPLGRGFTARRLHAALASRTAPIKNALLDQRLVAGLGNIYVCEALWEAAVDPRTPANRLDPATCARVVRAIRTVLRRAIRNCGTTLRDYRDGAGVRGRYQALLRVYGRAGKACRRCGSSIVRFVQSGRSSFGCPRCQR